MLSSQMEPGGDPNLESAVTDRRGGSEIDKRRSPFDAIAAFAGRDYF